MSKSSKVAVKGVAKTGNAAVVKPEVIKTEEKTQFKPMNGVDKKINNVIFDTKVNITSFYSKKKDKHYCFITIGQEQDKKFAVYARKDGKGVCVMTDFEEYQYSKQPKFAATV
jgi:hypothetical protein